MLIISDLKELRKKIMHIGVHKGLDSLEIRKLYIFNQLNFLGFITGIILPIAALFSKGYLPPIAWIVACSPAFISFSVLLCNHYRKYEQSMMIYFIFYPITTALVYAGNIDVGIELFFILYGVLSVFFLKNIKYILLAFCLSAVCYMGVYIFHKNYQFKMIDLNFGFYVANHLLAIVFIFVGLFMTKRENTSYQERILNRNKKLKTSYRKIAIQSNEIKEKASLLETKTTELTELNYLKDKLFSIVAHDLKTPIYSLRNLFTNMYRYDLPGEEIKVLLPDILTDLNYTTGLMENLLQWAKSQMKGATLNMQLLEVNDLVEEVKQLLRLQADSKKVFLKTKMDSAVYIYADKDMMNLVLRNLVSNAIKFTPENGEVNIGALQTADEVKLFVEDNGMGMTDENISKIFGNDFFTTKGTSNEAGTGLGLILCREFLQKNGGDISVETKPGKGSKFICKMPIP